MWSRKFPDRVWSYDNFIGCSILCHLRGSLTSKLDPARWQSVNKISHIVPGDEVVAE
jgi:hypothetical protein